MLGALDITRRHVLEALEERRQRSTIPIFRWLGIGVVSINLLVIAVALVIGPDAEPHLEFVEGGLVTYGSAGYMVATSGFAFLCFLLRFRAPGLGKLFWLMTSVGFFFFAVDELFEIHENLGVWANDAVAAPPSSLRNWDDLLVIGYGIVGLFVLLLFLPEVLRPARFAELLSIAFAFYIVHTAIDSIVLRNDIWKIAPEESAKLFSASFFALSMLIALIAVAKPLRINPSG